MKIAYICYQGHLLEGIPDEDTLLLQFLLSKGLDVHREKWTDTAVDWSAYDLVILKSPWDYIDNITAFNNWLSSLTVPLLNPYEIVRWNSDKHYIKEMMEDGMPVIPAAYIEVGATPLWDSYFEAFKSEKLIVKPCVSGGSKNTFVVTRGLNVTLPEEAMMVQPFMPEIVSGEWSYLFFNGKFSHCVLKTPVDGDFRVQHQFGGRASLQAPMHLKEASAFVSKYAKGCLYARVDGVVKEGRFLLMELELIEPLLFLFTHEKGCENYWNALLKMLTVSSLP